MLVLLLALVACNGERSTPIPGPDAGAAACSTRADCDALADGSGLVCGAEGRCVPCASDGECALRERCDSEVRRCVFREGWGADCKLNADCLAGSLCLQGLCIPEAEAPLCQDGRCPAEGQRCNRANFVCEEDLGCLVDADCSAAELCNLPTHTCVPRCTVQTQDQDCAPGQRCLQDRCSDCASDLDCPGGLVCSVERLQCLFDGQVRCLSDRDCAVGLTCNRATGFCTPEPPPCSSNESCLPGERCELASGRCLPRACQPDRYEPNGDAGHARTLTAGAFEGMTLCDREEDWYAVSLARGERLAVYVDADPLLGSALGARLLNAGGRVLAQGALALDRTIAEPGTYLLQVQSTDAFVTYGLRLTVTQAPPCDEDSFEPNDAPDAATVLGAGDHEGLSLCEADRDYYRIAVPPETGLDVGLEYLPSEGIIDLEVRAADSGQVLAEVLGARAIEQVSLDALAVGGRDVLVGVLPDSNRARNRYLLRVGAPPASATVVEAATLAALAEPLALGTVEPATGAIAGGTLVRITGTGFSADAWAEIGGAPLRDARVLDPYTLSGRTPPGAAGAVDVKVHRGAESAVRTGAFTYFDPTHIGGGSSGAPFDGTLNVTVLDRSWYANGEPVAGAKVVLGDDPSTPYQGLTDRRGQITFSDPALAGIEGVTVTKEGYEAVSVGRPRSQNLTVFIARTMSGTSGQTLPGPELGSGTGPVLPYAPAIVTGKVVGFKPPRPLREGEHAWAEVWVADTSVYSAPPFGWKATPEYRDARGERWKVERDGGSYTVLTSKGLRAIYAVYGIYDEWTKRFTPILMGVRRKVDADPLRPVMGADIVLDMHLDARVPVSIADPLLDGLHLPAFNEVTAWLDLGGEGVIPIGQVRAQQNAVVLPSMPRLDGDSFIFVNRATGNGSPGSYCFRRQLGELSTGVSIGPMIAFIELTRPQAGTSFDGQIGWRFASGPAPDLVYVTLSHSYATGYDSLWSAVLPGSATEARVPEPVMSGLRARYKPGDAVFLYVRAVRTPRFDYDSWSYSQFNLDAWTAWTELQRVLQM